MISLRRLVPVGLLLLAASCSELGPAALRRSRLRYNETVKSTSEQELLLNIVRLRYSDTPSSLAISSIAAQFELSGGLGVDPQVVAGADRSFTSVLPGGNISALDRPTFSMTPLDDTEFARRLFTPLSLEGALYLVKTTWPIQTVFRLYLQHLNGVSNAHLASGPTPREPPVRTDFFDGMVALQALQQRGQITFGAEEHKVPAGPSVAEVSASDVLSASQQGLSFVADATGRGWVLMRTEKRFVMHVDPAAFGSEELKVLRRVFNLREGQPRYEITLESQPPDADPGQEGFPRMDLETRSLIQALFFVSHGVRVPAEHLAQGIAPQTRLSDGSVFDWGPLLKGLFTVRSAEGDCGREPAHVAVPYQGYCFFIDRTDHDSKSTFALLMELARLQFPGHAGKAPVLTIPLGR